MKTLELKKNLYWTGVLDPDLKVFDIVMETEFGTSYNSYLLKTSQGVVLFETAKAKLFAAETAMDVTTKCVQLLGGYGYIREYDVERMMRDAKITEIYEGTSEVQRMVISGNLLR